MNLLRNWKLPGDLSRGKIINMEAADVPRENTSLGQALSPSAVQGVPWWGGGAHSMVSMDLAYSHTSYQGPRGVDSTFPDVLYPGVSSGESQTQTGTPVGLPSVPSDYVLPSSQLETEHGTVLAALMYASPFHDGIAAAQALQIHPHIFQHVRMALPVEVREEPVYVNAKQYRGIMRRRQSRAKAESENKLVKSRKPYLHESRHLHAMRRARGCGGRFLNMKKNDQAKASSERARSSESHLSDAYENKDHGQSYGAIANSALQTNGPMQ